MKTFKLVVTDQNSENEGVLTVKAKSSEVASEIAVRKGYKVVQIREHSAIAEAVNADAQYDLMRRAVFIGTVQSHIVFAVIIIIVLIVV